MLNFTKRNVLVFFKDKTAVLASMLTAVIIVALYAFFLGDTLKSGDIAAIKNSDYIMDSWLIAGLLAVTSVNTALGGLGVMVADKERKRENDFLSSPLKRRSIIGGYMLAAFVVGAVLSLITLILGEIYIAANGGKLLSGAALAETLAYVMLSVLSGSAFTAFAVSFLKSQSAFGTVSTLIGTLSGFLAGIYIPIGVLPQPVQWLIKLFPASHAAKLLRCSLIQNTISESFAGIPDEFKKNFLLELGYEYSFFGHTLGKAESIALLLLSAAVFYIAALANINRRRKS